MTKMYRIGLALFGVLVCGMALPAATGMVAVQVECKQKTISPTGWQRIKQLAADLEGTLLDRLFEEGHIAFNTPAEIHMLDARPDMTLVENLLSQTHFGGGQLLILCRVQVSEPKANEALTILSATVSAMPLERVSGFPQTWTLPLKPGQDEADFKAGMLHVARLVVAKIGEIKDSTLALGRGD